MIDNLFDVLYVAKTGKIKPDASLTDNLYGKKFYDAHSGIITTATGNPVSIVTNKAQNAISTILTYSPRQSGTGDPSPQNIRPIEGWTEANLGVNSETPTITANLGGTYYGFSIDLERGVLRNTYNLYTVTENTRLASFSQSAQYGSWAIINDLGIPAIDSTKILAYSDMAVGVSYNNRVVNVDKQRVYSETNLKRIALRASASDNITSVDDLKESFMGATIAYAVPNPIELPLTPQTVALLAGNNTLWCDGDDVSITYKAKK